MLVLYETAAGYALFKLSDKGKLEERDMYEDFKTAEVPRLPLRLLVRDAVAERQQAGEACRVPQVRRHDRGPGSHHCGRRGQAVQGTCSGSCCACVMCRRR